MRSYPKYKSSGVDWLSEVPDDWGLEKLKFKADIQFSNVDKLSEALELPILLCNYVDVYKNEKIHHEINFMQATANTSEISKFKIKKGDVLITKDSESADDIAVPALVVEDFENVLCGYHLAQIKSKKTLTGEYLFRLFQSKNFNHNFEASASGMTRYGLSVSSIKNVFVLIPSLSEQQKIVDFLDYKMGQCDRFISNRQKQIELLNEQLHFKINQAITKGINSKVKFKPTDIKYVPEIPEHWDIRKFKSLTSILTCGVAATPEYVEKHEGVLFLSAQNVKPFRMVFDKLAYIKQELHKKLTRNKKPMKGDVLVTRIGGDSNIGDACVVSIDSEFSVYVSLTHIRPNKEILSEYIVYFFNTEYCYQLNHEGTVVAGGQGNLNVKNVERYRIPLPPVEEQKEIITYLDNYRKEIDNLISKYQKQIELMQEYRTALISQAVTGKIDVRDWKPK
jgi:type I restriction enzyme S subunit